MKTRANKVKAEQDENRRWYPPAIPYRKTLVSTEIRKYENDGLEGDDTECFDRVCEVSFEVIPEAKWREETLGDVVLQEVIKLLQDNSKKQDLQKENEWQADPASIPKRKQAMAKEEDQALTLAADFLQAQEEHWRQRQYQRKHQVVGRHDRTRPTVSGRKSGNRENISSGQNVNAIGAPRRMRLMKINRWKDQSMV
ncbi:hypothetical protein NDU88_003982 [Pleurodeles waltl]|uniref:Uncharacterized protein n=1 Tax=Pleurodeles waltl TaxID=8319 RepID=A0AAV7QES7_PLEWA|nr:hypothetical protein NDU88_003982 [Pleurodeles waltl]